MTHMGHTSYLFRTFDPTGMPLLHVPYSTGKPKATKLLPITDDRGIDDFNAAALIFLKTVNQLFGPVMKLNSWPKLGLIHGIV